MATAFVRDKDLVRVPDEPVAVIEMPEYRRGVAVAYCDSSGPLEPKPETFFAISPSPTEWAPPRVERSSRAECPRRALRAMQFGTVNCEISGSADALPAAG